MAVLFEYMYRDAGNFKAFGKIALTGWISDASADAIRAKLPFGELFIAEQLGVPALYDKLYTYSGGPTGSDHCWHTFVDLRPLADEVPPDTALWGTADEFVARLRAVEAWDEDLSPHFRMWV